MGGLTKVYGGMSICAVVARSADKGTPNAGRMRRGSAPPRYVRGSASIHRHILQQLEKMKLLQAQDAG